MLLQNPAWTVFSQEGLLLISKGGDESYVVDEVDTPEFAQKIAAIFASGALSLLSKEPLFEKILALFLEMGVLYPAHFQQNIAALSLFWCGEPMPDFVSQWQKETRLSLQEDAHFSLVIRTNATWQETLAHYQKTESLRHRPHLFVDLAYANTMSIGPYVVPNETACVGCLGNRIAHRFGDPPLPVRPSMTDEVIFLQVFLRRALQDDKGTWQTPIAFLERITSLDLRDVTMQSSRLFQLPGCPVCGTPHPETPLDLPWST